jgi:hypothetical protein
MCPNLYARQKPQRYRPKSDDEEGDVRADEPRLPVLVDVRLHVRNLLGCSMIHDGIERVSDRVLPSVLETMQCRRDRGSWGRCSGDANVESGRRSTRARCLVSNPLSRAL